MMIVYLNRAEGKELIPKVEAIFNFLNKIIFIRTCYKKLLLLIQNY